MSCWKVTVMVCCAERSAPAPPPGLAPPGTDKGCRALAGLARKANRSRVRTKGTAAPKKRRDAVAQAPPRCPALLERGTTRDAGSPLCCSESGSISSHSLIAYLIALWRAMLVQPSPVAATQGQENATHYRGRGCLSGRRCQSRRRSNRCRRSSRCRKSRR